MLLLSITDHCCRHHLVGQEVVSNNLRTEDGDPQNFLDQQADSGSVVHEKLRTRTDADPVPWRAFYFQLEKVAINDALPLKAARRGAIAKLK